MAGAEQKRALVYREAAHGTHAVLKLARNLVIKVYESATSLTFEMKVIVTLLRAHILIRNTSCPRVTDTTNASVCDKL